MFRVLLIATLLFCTSNCSSVETVAEVDKFDVVPNKKLTSGLSYYLPKNLIRINFHRNVREVPEAARALTAAKVRAAQIASRLSLAQAAAEHAELEAISAPAAVAVELRRVADLKKAAFEATRKEKAAHDKVLKDAELAFEKALAAGRLKVPTADSIDIGIEAAVADTRYRFTIQGVHLPTHDSRFNFVVTDKGLLSVASARIQDRFPEIAVNLARLGITAAVGVPLAPADRAADQIAELALDPISAAAARSEGGIAAGADEDSDPVGSPDDGVNMAGEKVVAGKKSCDDQLKEAQDQLGKLRATHKNTAAASHEKREEYDANDEETKLERRIRYLKIVCFCQRSVDVSRPTEATWIIDPARYSAVLSVNCELQKLGSNLRVRVLRWPDARRSAAAHTTRFDKTSHEGIVYRAPTDYKLAIVELRTIQRTRGGRVDVADRGPRKARLQLLAIVKEEHNFVLPNGGPIRALPFRYSMCSVAGYQVQFADGMPVRQQIDHRSELAACSAIPLQIISDIIEAPIKMLDFQTDRLKKEKALDDARRQLEETRKPPGPGSP